MLVIVLVMVLVMIVMLLVRFKNVHKRRAELESVARIDAEDELDGFTSPRHEPSFGASEAAFGVAGGSGAETRVGFMGEAPSQPKNSRRGAAFSYQQQAHPQVKPYFSCT